METHRRGVLNPLARTCESREPAVMSHPDDIRQPLDHLPPLDERDKAVEIEEPSYPTDSTPTGTTHASPETAAEPDKPHRHGVDKLPPSSR